MTTTVTKTIGAGGDYATLALWFAAAPVSLVAADQVWQGKILNATDAFTDSGGSSLLTISGNTTDATRYFELTTAAGASFRDNASVQTNALRYNGSNGCAMSMTTVAGTAISINQNYTRISNLQISALGRALDMGAGAGALNCDVNNCILEGNDAVNFVARVVGASNKIRNSLIVQRASAAANIVDLTSGPSLYNCTLAVPNDLTAASVGVAAHYGAPTMINCAVFKVSAFSSGTAPTLTTCASDLAAATGRIQVPYNTSAFVNITDATRDFRLVTGSGLVGAGTTDSANAAADIAGTSRPSGVGYDIGAWELVVAGGGTKLFRTNPGGNLSGVGSSGPFFQNPLQRVADVWKRRNGIFVPLNYFNREALA